MTRVLFLTYDFPYPTNTGGKNRAFNLLRYTAKKMDVYLYSFVRTDFNPEHLEILRNEGVKDIKVFKRREAKKVSNIPLTLLHNSSIFKTLYFDKKAKEEILDFVKEYDINLVHFESAYTGFYLCSELKKRGVTQVLGTENIEHLLYRDYASTIRKPFLKPIFHQQASRLKKEELSMFKRADACVAVTRQEATYISSYSKKLCGVVPNGIHLSDFKFSFNEKKQHNLLFVGNFTYFPNVDAMNFFYKEVFQKLKNPPALTIVGKKGQDVLGYTNEKVIFKEFVEDITAEYRTADALVFPVRIGGGTNFKVLEAMSLGTPIIALPQRLAGFNAVENKDFLKASTGEEFIEQIEAMYEDKINLKSIALSARKLVDQSYSWDNIGEELVRTWKKTIHE